MELVKEDFKHSFSSATKFSKSPCEWLCSYPLKLKEVCNKEMIKDLLN